MNEDDRFWRWLVSKVCRPMTPKQAEKEYNEAPESPLSEEEIEDIVRRVVDK